MEIKDNAFGNEYMVRFVVESKRKRRRRRGEKREKTRHPKVI